MSELENVTENLENLENNLITVINDLKTSTEIILKELTGYLNVSAHDLTEIRSSVVKIETVLDNLKNYITKLDSIEKELNNIKPSLIQTENNILNNMNDKFSANNISLKKIAAYINQIYKLLNHQDNKNEKKLIVLEEHIKNIANSLEDTKNELVKSQEGLYTVINTLTSNKTDIEKAEINLKDSIIKSETEKQNTKLLFITKIIGIFFGSGGIMFFIIKSIIDILKNKG